MVHTTASTRTIDKTCLPIGKLTHSCFLAVLLALFSAQVLAQGSNVDLSEPAERVNETRDDNQSETEGVVLVYFAFGSETLESDSEVALRSLAEQAMANPDRSVIIAAHTDNRGWALGNLELSRIRARSVAKALMANGVEVARMRAFAFGESQPLATNSTAQGRRLNRRVEISLKP